MVRVKATSPYSLKRYRNSSFRQVRIGFFLMIPIVALWLVFAVVSVNSGPLRSTSRKLVATADFEETRLKDDDENNHNINTAVESALAVALDWCASDDCKERLEAFKSKLELEETIFRFQYHMEKRRKKFFLEQDAKRVEPSKEEVLQWHYKEIGETSNPKYWPKPEWKELGSFPKFNVVANLKTGTSQLFNVLNTHRDVGSIEDDWKEHCAKDHYGSDSPEQDTYEYALYGWHDFYFSRKQYISETEAKPQVNGCIGMNADLERRYAYNPPKEGTKFFILLRDPADWAWAAYNFFCDPSWEDYPLDDNWVDERKHYRSPEVFHEVVLSGGKLLGFGLLAELRERSITIIRRLRNLVGTENLIILKNEDLQPHVIQSSGLLERLSETTGLPLDGFDPSVVHSRSNCNANKGYGEKCIDNRDTAKDKHSHASVGYPVTQNRPMLEATRKFIYLQWHVECKIWAEEFGVVYPDCLAAIPDDPEDEEDEEDGEERAALDEEGATDGEEEESDQADGDQEVEEETL